MTAATLSRAPALASSWCPTCEEFTILDVGRACAWCDTVTVAPPAAAATPARRGKPKGKHARVTDRQLAAIHHVYVTRGVSVRGIAAQVWETLGYASEGACATSLYSLLVDRGYQLRSQSQVTIDRNLKHGKASRNGRVEHGPDGYRRWLKTELGRYQPVCAGVKTCAPGKGKPCERHALVGSDFCAGHDPARKAERDAQVARMRARQPKRETRPWADVRAQLDPWLEGRKHPAAALANATGVPWNTCARLLFNQRDTLTVQLADRLLKALEDPA